MEKVRVLLDNVRANVVGFSIEQNTVYIIKKPFTIKKPLDTTSHQTKKSSESRETIYFV